MTTLKRVLAGALATVLLFNSSVNYRITVFANTSDLDESTFSVNIPEGWTNSIENWVEASDDLKVYYKTSDKPKKNSTWGSYTDSDAKEWTGSNVINETDSEGDYIKFWTVKDDSVQNNPDAVRYYLDKTAPNGFSLVKDLDEVSGLYILHNKEAITDSLSGIKAIYYSIGREYKTVEEITYNAVAVECNTVKNGVSFSIMCSLEMDGDIVNVYAIDNVGNIQTSSIFVDSYMDTSAPSLIVTGIDANNWINKDLMKKKWYINTDSKGAKIYYAVSDEDLGDGWGSYTNATEWSKDAVIPEGEKYIHFWAAYDSPERDVAEETRAYKYDNSVASLTFNDTQRIFDPDTYTWKLNISSNTLFDEYSGVSSVRIRYYDGSNPYINQELSESDVTRGADGTIEAFSVDLGDRIVNSKIAFFVTDKAGNSKEYYLNGNNAIDFDPQSPFIDMGSLKILSSEQEPLSYYAFGSKNQGNENNSVYVKDDAYIYLEVIDNDLRAIQITVNEKSPIEIKEKDLANGNGEWKKEAQGRSNNNKYYIRIKTSLLKEKLAVNSKNYISLVALDNDLNHESNIATFNIDEDNQYSILYDPKDDKDVVIIPTTSISPSTADDGNKYYGKNYNENSITYDINDDNGIKAYSVKVNGTVVATEDLSSGIETNGDDETYYLSIDKTSYTIPLEKGRFDLYDFSKDGRYEIVVSAEDLAGNHNDNNYTFIIDTTAPVITNCEYKYNKSMIRYLSFGLFGKESYDISVKVNDVAGDDGVLGIGVDSVKLFWDSDTVPYEGHYNSENGLYEFPSLCVGHNAIPVIVVADKLGNTARYCMVSADNTDDNDDHRVNIQLEELKLEDSVGRISLVLEDTPPKSSVKLIESFEMLENASDDLKIYKQIFEDGHEEWWYPNNFKYYVVAQDENSGLYSVVITENEVIKATESAYNKVSFSSEAVDSAIYSYGIKNEGDYKLFTYAIDNAQNTNWVNPLAEQTCIVHLDKTKPQITEFKFGGNSDQGESVERTTYGFFFTEDTEVRVYVDDFGVSSGLDNVTLYLDSVDGESKKVIQAAGSFKSEYGRRYASFTIEKGFKGKVTSIVTDNVGHTSGLISANGTIVEDSDLHSRTSSIEIKANETAKQNDAYGVPLYNTNIPVTVTVEDTFSGIKTIDWSIADDKEEGQIEVSLDGSWNNIKGDAQIIETSVVRDQNLITKLQFVIVVDSNTNGNVVHITLTDRSGNKSEYEATYSIDTTVPTITAVLGGEVATNGYYYNSDQVVTVSITERNFDPSAVVVMLNDSAQTIQWNEKNASASTDSTVHTGTFAITTDGEYSFTVSYADMAGNAGAQYSQSQFIIDKTSPKITNNFESFGSIDDEEIFYSISKKDEAKAEITVVERNFTPSDMNVVVYYQPAGSKHSDTDANWSTYYYSVDWTDDHNDRHTLIIPFTEDGVYKITMSPVDRAGNAGDFSGDENSQYPGRTAIFETDYTAPIIVSRGSNIVKPDDDKFYDLYDFERRNDDAPTVVFEDTNIDRIVCKGQKYTPVYTNGREIGEIKPEVISSESKKAVIDSYVPQMVYTLDSFTTDGVYSVKLIAYDKAGNESILIDNTYVRMIDPTVNVLAYIENSNHENQEGWYSFEDENGPISKQPGSFSDLSIVVLSTTPDTRICLVDKSTNTSTDTYVTDTKNAIFDDGMYKVSAYRYTLPGDYFEQNYTADADKNLYLRVVNSGESLDLGEIYIDNTNPDCSIPEHFHDWGWFGGSKNQTIRFDNISEVLDINETVAYVDGQTIHLSNIAGNESSVFSYDEKSGTLSLTLEPGSHKVGLLLVDRAGNTKSISEVQHLAIGNYRIWIGIGIILGAALMAVIVAVIVKRVRRRQH